MQLLTLVLSLLTLTSAWPQNAGTICNVNSDIGAMKASKHGSGGGTSSFSMAAKQSGSGYQITLSGGTSFTGLVIYARDDAGKYVGSFSGFPSSLSYKSDCGGGSNSILEHNSASNKAMPFNLNWSPGSATGKVTFEAMVVVTTRAWSNAKSLSLDLSGSTPDVVSSSTTKEAASSTTSVKAVSTSSAKVSTKTTSPAKTTSASPTATEDPTPDPNPDPNPDPTPEDDTANLPRSLAGFANWTRSASFFPVIWSLLLGFTLIGLIVERADHSIDQRKMDLAKRQGTLVRPSEVEMTRRR